MILVMFILTLFTTSPYLSLFFHFRVAQCRLMILAVVHGLHPNPKLRSILEGCANLRSVWSSDFGSHCRFSETFFQPDAVYIRFTHVSNLQPKFYIGSASHGVLHREHSRFRKFLQLQNDRLVQAELSLRFWQDHNNLFIWCPLPLFTGRNDFRAMELALIQEWQPKLNFPFICQFHHPRKGLLKKPQMNMNAQFGLATLWRRARHRFTPKTVKDIILSERFQNRLTMWKLIHSLGSNTLSRFETTRFLRSNEGGLTMCYALRRLAQNIQEPFRSLALQAIDTTIRWWKGKPAPRICALRAPWILSPDLEKELRRFLRSWYTQALAHHVPCHPPSLKTIFVKHSSVVDILCNQKQAIEDWGNNISPTCVCDQWRPYQSACFDPTADHWVLHGYSLGDHLPADLQVIAEGSLQNKVFPSKREFSSTLRQGLKQWCKDNGLPSFPQGDVASLLDRLWQQHREGLSHHIRKQTITTFTSTFPGAVFHCEDKQASSLRLFCPVLYHSAISKTFLDKDVFEIITSSKEKVLETMTRSLQQQFGRSYPWALGKGQLLPSGYILPKKKKAYSSGRPIISFVDVPFRPMLNILARLLFQLIPVACPSHFATGDVYTLLEILRSAPKDGDYVLYNQDLAGFFTSIDQDRFIGAW